MTRPDDSCSPGLGRCNDGNVGSGPKRHRRYAKGKVYDLKFTVSKQGVSVQKLVPSFYWTGQPHGICPRKCKCLMKEKGENAGSRLSDVSLSITGRERQRLAGYDQHVCLSVQNSSATHNVLI